MNIDKPYYFYLSKQLLVTGRRRNLDLRERHRHEVAGRHSQVQGPPQVQDHEGERGERDQCSQIVQCLATTLSLCSSVARRSRSTCD